MPEPKWIQNLKWNASELSDLVGSKLGSPPVNLEPTEAEVIEYFQSYVTRAEELLERTIQCRTRLQKQLEHLNKSDPDSPLRPGIERSLAIIDEIVLEEDKYVDGLAEQISALLSVNGYQSRSWALPADHEPTDAE